MAQQIVKEAIKNLSSQTSKNILDVFTKEKFEAKFRDCKNAWYDGYEVITELKLKINYHFLNPEHRGSQNASFIVEL